MNQERRARLEDLECRPASVRLPVARRDLTARKALRLRILSEFTEMPGMSLTTAQASRLFGIHPEACRRIFDELASAGMLLQRTNGRYGLAPASLGRKAG